MADDYTYRNLMMWDRAQQLALEVIKIVQRLPDTWGNAVIARQIIASATSIGANIAEGHARYTPGAHRNHLSIAKGSTAETDSWLDLLRRSGHLSVAEEARLHAECQEIMAMLTTRSGHHISPIVPKHRRRSRLHPKITNLAVRNKRQTLLVPGSQFSVLGS